MPPAFQLPLWAKLIYPGSSAETIALLAVGGCLLVAFAVNELLTNRAPIIAPRLFKVRRVCTRMFFHLLISTQARAPAICLYTNFLHAVGFFSSKVQPPSFHYKYSDIRLASYYLPVYFQVIGNSATGGGVRYVIPL